MVLMLALLMGSPDMSAFYHPFVGVGVIVMVTKRNHVRIRPPPLQAAYWKQPQGNDKLSPCQRVWT
jgi:hypothetical protein